MPSLVAELRRELPDVRLELHGEQLTPAQVERLVDGRLDLGLLRPPVRTPEIEVEVVRSEPLVAVLPAGHVLANGASVRVADLAEEPFVTYPSEARSVLHEAVEATCRAHGFFPRVGAEVGETGTLVAFVAAGLGVSLAPQSVMGLSIAGAVYRPLADERHAEGRSRHRLAARRPRARAAARARAQPAAPAALLSEPPAPLRLASFPCPSSRAASAAARRPSRSGCRRAST